jgi:hypothetical protein
MAVLLTAIAVASTLATGLAVYQRVAAARRAASARSGADMFAARAAPPADRARRLLSRAAWACESSSPLPFFDGNSTWRFAFGAKVHHRRPPMIPNGDHRQPPPVGLQFKHPSPLSMAG